MLLTELQTALLSSIERNPRIYCKTYAATFRWACDDSKAEQDAQHFKDLIQNLGLEPPEEHTIVGRGLPNDGVIPRLKFFEMARAAVKTTYAEAEKGNRDSRALVIVHYAGHAKIDDNNALLFQKHPTSQETISAMGAFWELTLNEPEPGSLDNVDFLFIFDSWFGGPVPREPPGKSRIVEILAAARADKSTSESHPFNPRTKELTFTSKLAQLVKSRKGTTSTVGFGEIISELKISSSIFGPQHHILLGPKSIRIPLPAPEGQILSLPIDPSYSKPYNAIFSIRVRERSMPEHKIQEVARSIESYSIGVRITVLTVYETVSSTGFIIESPYWVFLNLSGRDGVRLVFGGTMGRGVLCPGSLGHCLEEVGMK